MKNKLKLSGFLLQNHFLFWKLPINYSKAIRDVQNDKFEKFSLGKYIFDFEQRKINYKPKKLKNLK